MELDGNSSQAESKAIPCILHATKEGIGEMNIHSHHSVSNRSEKHDWYVRVDPHQYLIEMMAKDIRDEIDEMIIKQLMDGCLSVEDGSKRNGQ